MPDDRSPHYAPEDGIDRIVREMTAIEPLPGFEGRVMRRLHRRAPPLASWSRLTACAVVLAAVAVFAILGREERVAPAPPVATAARSADPPSATDRTSRVQSVAQGPSIEASSRKRAAISRRLSRSVVAPDAGAPSLEHSPVPMITALERPSELRMETIAAGPVNIAEITMSRIDIDDLHVQPLQSAGDDRKE